MTATAQMVRVYCLLIYTFGTLEHIDESRMLSERVGTIPLAKALYEQYAKGDPLSDDSDIEIFEELVETFNCQNVRSITFNAKEYEEVYYELQAQVAVGMGNKLIEYLVNKIPEYTLRPIVHRVYKKLTVVQKQSLEKLFFED